MRCKSSVFTESGIDAAADQIHKSIRYYVEKMQTSFISLCVVSPLKGRTPEIA